MRAVAPGSFVALLGACVLVLGPAVGAGVYACTAPVVYPGDDAPRADIAQWMAHGALVRGIPAELPVMAALVESGLQNLNIGDSDQAGYFGMRRPLWDSGVYAGFPDHPELQLTWFTDQALMIRTARIAAGDVGFGTDPSRWGDWVADVERPAEQFRGRYQLRLDDARALIAASCSSVPQNGDAPQNLAVTNGSLAPATVGSPYVVQLTATGGGMLTWSVASGVLPAGLTLGADGTLSGTPTAAAPAPATFVVKVSDGARTDTKPLALDVVAPLAVTRPTVPAAEVKHALTPMTLVANGGRSPYTWALGVAPAWITLGPASARLNGTPTAAGTYPLQISVHDIYGTAATLDLTITVKAKAAIKPARLPRTRVGKLYRATLRTVGGVAPFAWKVISGNLPVGIRLDRKAGVLSGKAGKAGTYPLRFAVTDSLGETSRASLTLTVTAFPKDKKK